MRELQRLERDHPDLVTLDSPTQRVGGRTAEGFASVRHAEPMLSLDNAYNEDELRAFDERLRRGLDNLDGPVPYVAELKIDGLSIALQYRDGAPRAGSHARRRHDGRGRHAERQDDQGHSTRARGRPEGHRRNPRRDLPASQRVRADQQGARRRRRATVRQSAQRRIGRDSPDRSRAGPKAAGCARSFISSSAETACPSTHRELLETLEQWGLPVEPHWKALKGIDKVAAYCAEWGEKRSSGDRALAFDTDGVVIKLDDIALARPARHDVEVSTMGDRLQVSAGAGRDDA